MSDLKKSLQGVLGRRVRDPKQFQKLVDIVTNNPRTIRLNANIPLDLYLDLKKIAIEKRSKLTDIVITLIADYLKSEREKLKDPSK